MIERVDPRRETALADEMRRRAEAILGAAGTSVEPGPVEDAIITVAARIGEEVTQRLDRVPNKQADNFYTAIGIGRAPARPARVPVAFKLSDSAPADLVAPEATKLSVSTGSTPTIFETQSGLDLARGSITQFVAVDLDGDRIFVSPPGVPQAQLPPAPPIQRWIVGGAAAGATVVQIAPVTGLAKGMAISIQTAEGAAEYGITAVEDDLVTIEPPLAANVAESDKVAEVSVFSPFEKGARDQQSHSLYLSHPTLLDLPSKATIFVSGLNLEQIPDWSWFGKIDPDAPKPDWQPFDEAAQTATGWTLEKPKGKPEKTPVDGRSALWIRAKLPGPSKQTEFGKTIRLSVGDPADCKAGRGSCDNPENSVGYEAVAVTTPVVTNKPYYPFGREPRLFDSFYVGCAEAFGKEGAQVSLCFELGGSTLGALAAASSGDSIEIYGVGTDGLLWRASLTKSRGATFEPVRGPAYNEGRGFEKQAFVSARLDGAKLRVAVADNDSIHIATLDYGAPVPPDGPKWTQLSSVADEKSGLVASIFLGGDQQQTVQAFVPASGKLLTWENGQTLATVSKAVDLVPVQNADAALLIKQDGAATWTIELHNDRGISKLEKGLAEDEFAQVLRSAWSETGLYYIAGFEKDDGPSEQLLLTRVEEKPSGLTVGRAPPGPVTFERLADPGLPVMLAAGAAPALPAIIVAAAAPPTIFVPTGPDTYEPAAQPDIGVSSNAKRQLRTVGDWTIVQNADQGLLYRQAVRDDAGNPHTFYDAAFPGSKVLVVEDAAFPADAQLAQFTGAEADQYFKVDDENRVGDRLLLPNGDASLPVSGDAQFYEKESDRKITVSNGKITIDGQTLLNDVDVLVEAGGPEGIWHLEFISASKFEVPDGFNANGVVPCTLLETKGGPVPRSSFHEYFQLSDDSLERKLGNGPLHSLYDANVVISNGAVEHFGTTDAIPLPHIIVHGDVARFAVAADAWQSVGPNQPANPALSWEYWNGSAWWALDQSNFLDDTANLQVKGGLYFTVPADLEETEVGGKNDRWIRARLVGGDYGEARVTVIDTPSADRKSTEHTVNRDLSAIRAPYLTKLTIIYCAVVPAKPQLLLGADNLGVADRTGANDADVPVPIFPPVSTLFESLVPAAVPRIDEECCERWFEAKPDADSEPEKKLDERSCERWFALASSGEIAKGDQKPTRALLIGLDQQPRAGRLSLYFDLMTGGASGSLDAQFFRGGTVEPVTVAEDGSSGLTERGAVAVQIENPPDLLQLFGTAAYWLRITAKGVDSKWSPRVRGVYLNGTMASSVESRSIETVGASSGEPDQKLYLAASPIDPDSLVLQVQEPVGAEDAIRLNAVAEISGMPGPWVQWARVDALDDDRPGQRRFMVDAETGTLTFGDGKTSGSVPPIGSQILAESYARVVGSEANAVAAGDKVDMVAPLAGVDEVIALDAAAGGIDIESADDARMRAPAKIRTEGSIVSLADVEDFVRTRVRSVAQARASNWRGGVRVIVVASGADPVPPPSALAAAMDAVEKAATYRLRASGVLSVIGPRLLPLDIRITIEPDPEADFVTLEQDTKGSVAALLNHETGGLDGRGWPVGVLPSKADIAAALEPLTNQAVVRVESISRSDRKSFPDQLPADVLVRADGVAVELAKRAAA